MPDKPGPSPVTGRARAAKSVIGSAPSVSPAAAMAGFSPLIETRRPVDLIAGPAVPDIDHMSHLHPDLQSALRQHAHRLGSTAPEGCAAHWGHGGARPMERSTACLGCGHGILGAVSQSDITTPDKDWQVTLQTDRPASVSQEFGCDLDSDLGYLLRLNFQGVRGPYVRQRIWQVITAWGESCDVPPKYQCLSLVDEVFRVWKGGRRSMIGETGDIGGGQVNQNMMNMTTGLKVYIDDSGRVLSPIPGPERTEMDSETIYPDFTDGVGGDSHSTRLLRSRLQVQNCMICKIVIWVLAEVTDGIELTQFSGARYKIPETLDYIPLRVFIDGDECVCPFPPGQDVVRGRSVTFEGQQRIEKSFSDYFKETAASKKRSYSYTYLCDMCEKCRGGIRFKKPPGTTPPTLKEPDSPPPVPPVPPVTPGDKPPEPLAIVVTPEEHLSVSGEVRPGLRLPNSGGRARGTGMSQ